MGLCIHFVYKIVIAITICAILTLLPRAHKGFLPLLSGVLYPRLDYVENLKWMGGAAELSVDLNERSREIGEALRRARVRSRRSIRVCAAHIGTSPRRYADIERGTIYVAAVELEELVAFLAVPPHEVWPQAVIDKSRRRVVIDAHPGESVEMVVNIAASPTENDVRIEPNG